MRSAYGAALALVALAASAAFAAPPRIAVVVVEPAPGAPFSVDPADFAPLLHE